MVGFSEFAFLSGTSELKTLALEVTWGDTHTFSVIIYNKENIDMNYRLWFVDAGVTNDWFSQPACLGQNETWTVGKYVTGDTSFFTMPAQSNTSKTLSITFPGSYSWYYTWCIMFFPTLTALNTAPGGVSGMAYDAHTLPRRGWFISALVHPSDVPVPVIVKAFPSNRVYQANNNANRWVIKFYDTNKQFVASSTLFELNGAGTGEWLVNVLPGTYYVFFKWQSHLASYLSGVIVTNTLSWSFFDFTTGTNLYGAQNLDAQTNNGMKYQTAWDLKPTVWDYDNIVNGNDISIILPLFPSAWINVLEPVNLNGDSEINSSDIGIIWTNFLQEDAFKEWILFTWH
jgi:hypothetical protein